MARDVRIPGHHLKGVVAHILRMRSREAYAHIRGSFRHHLKQSREIDSLLPFSLEIIAIHILTEQRHLLETSARIIERKEWLDSFTLKTCEPLFLRITEALLPESSSSAALLEPAPAATQAPAEKQDKAQQIGIETFGQIQIRVGTIQHAEKIEKSDKLLRLLVDVGEEKPRQIVAGIGKSYAPESLLGQQVCVLCNLKPTKLMGVMSEGMILAAKDSHGLQLIAPVAHIAAGSAVG